MNEDVAKLAIAKLVNDLGDLIIRVESMEISGKAAILANLEEVHALSREALVKMVGIPVEDDGEPKFVSLGAT
jgi:hypothetical protein